VATGPHSAVSAGMGRMDVRNGGQQPVTGSYGGPPEPVSHGGFHPADSAQHDRR
jgi:hypothetical protein